MVEIAERAIASKRMWPKTEVVCCKRDIDAAFKRVRTHPDMSINLCADFHGGHFELGGRIVFLYLATPFGWRASPAYFPSVGRGITLAHRDFCPTSKIRDGGQDFASLLFVDDAIFIEPRIGRRPEACVAFWEDVCREFLGGDSLNKDKLDEEGDWENTHILLGYEVNVNSSTVRLPDAKMNKAWDVIRDPAFAPGARIIPVKQVQTMRGLINHWAGAGRFWKYMASPFSALLGYADETNTWVRFCNDQVLIAVWNLANFLRACSEDEAVWHTLFDGSLLDLISAHKRLSFQEPDSNVVWPTGDSVLGRFDAINWTDRTYVVENTMDFLLDLNPVRREIVISDVEQMAATCIVAVWGEPAQVLLLGTDNQNVLACANKGYAKRGVALILNQVNAKWIAKRRLVVGGFFLRIGHNFSADWISRASLEDILEWAHCSGFRRIRYQARWNDSIAEWKQTQIDFWIPGPSRLGRCEPRFPGKCVEWNSDGGSLWQAAYDMGVPISYLYPRHSAVVERMGKNTERRRIVMEKSLSWDERHRRNMKRVNSSG